MFLSNIPWNSPIMLTSVSEDEPILGLVAPNGRESEGAVKGLGGLDILDGEADRECTELHDCLLVWTAPTLPPRPASRLPNLAMTEPKSSQDYVARVNRVIDHVQRNLREPLRLEHLAELAGFSSFHFHRIFKSLVGETLQTFVRRHRLQRALSLMSNEPGLSLTEVALKSGFAGSSDFSRAFKQRFGLAPSAFDIQAHRRERRGELEQLESETGKLLERLPSGQNPDGFEVRIREIPARRVAYIRVLDPFRPDVVPEAAERLVDWAEERGFADGQWLGYMWEDPDFVPLDKCRYDVGIVAPGAEAEDEIGCIDFPAMTVAEVELRGDIALEVRALDWLSGTWLPRSRYRPADLPCFEAWMGRPFAQGLEHFELWAQFPIVAH